MFYGHKLSNKGIHEMKVTIEYCHVWNYYPHAASLAQEIKNNINDVEIEYIKSSGGVFEVEKDGKLIYSKRQTGRFPEASEIIGLLT